MSATNPKIYSLSQAKLLMAAQIRQLDLKVKPAVYRIEIKIKPVDSIAWVQAQGVKVKIYGANQDDAAAIAGIGEALSVKGPAVGSLKAVFNQLRQYLSPQYPYLQWYGGFCFDDKHLDKGWREFGAYRFVLPRFELARDKDKMIFACNLIGPINELNRRNILKDLDQMLVRFKLKKQNLKVNHRRDMPSLAQWKLNAGEVLNGILKKKYAKIVLARKTVLTFTQTVNPFVIFRQLHQVTPNAYHFCFQFGKTAFLGASPERLYKRQGRMISSEAVAGTARRGKTTAEDLLLKGNLKRSVKDNHEHQFVVTAIKERLSPLCKKLTHEDQPQVMSLGNGHHLNTPFIGELNSGVKDEDVLQSLHPTPAVAGTPTQAALSMIRQREGFSRGWYAGPLGYVGLDWVELVVGIRSGLMNGKQLAVFAGAGLVQGSDPKAEWDEIENKISNFIKVIK